MIRAEKTKRKKMYRHPSRWLSWQRLADDSETIEDEDASAGRTAGRFH